MKRSREVLKRALSVMIRDFLKLIPSFLLVTIVGGLLSSRYQRQVAAENRKAQEIAANREAATQLQAKLGPLIGRRLYREQAAVMRQPETGPFLAPEQLREVQEWYEQRPVYLAMLCRFFGLAETLRLDEIMLQLDYVELLRRAERDALVGKEHDLIARYIPDARGGPDSIRTRMLSRLDSLSVEVYLFQLALADRVRRGDFDAASDGNCASDALRANESLFSIVWRLRLASDPDDTLAR